MSEQRAVFGTGGEHTVRLFGTLGDKVIYQYPYISLVALKHKGRLLLYLTRGIDPCDKPLRACFFVTCRPIDLTGKKEIFYQLSLQGCFELCWRKIIIFYGVTRAEKLHLFEACDLAQGLILYLFRERSGEAIDIHLYRMPAFGFYKELMAILIGKAVDLILNRRTIAWPHSLDTAGKHRGAVKACTQYIMHLLAGIGHITIQLMRKRLR